MKIIIGLGNPGEKYQTTKHNVGFVCLDYLVEKKGLVWENNKKLNAIIAKDGNTLYVKPQTFMNNSGISANAVLSYYKLLPKKLALLRIKNADLSDTLTVIHDDIDIALGKYKVSVDSRSAGHNGVQSIINHLKTKNFKRIRIGIYNEERKMVPRIKVVLEKFNQKEQMIIDNLLPNIDIEK